MILENTYEFLDTIESINKFYFFDEYNEDIINETYKFLKTLEKSKRYNDIKFLFFNSKLIREVYGYSDNLKISYKSTLPMKIKNIIFREYKSFIHEDNKRRKITDPRKQFNFRINKKLIPTFKVNRIYLNDRENKFLQEIDFLKSDKIHHSISDILKEFLFIEFNKSILKEIVFDEDKTVYEILDPKKLKDENFYSSFLFHLEEKYLDFLFTKIKLNIEKEIKIKKITISEEDKKYLQALLWDLFNDDNCEIFTDNLVDNLSIKSTKFIKYYGHPEVDKEIEEIKKEHNEFLNKRELFLEFINKEVFNNNLERIYYSTGNKSMFTKIDYTSIKHELQIKAIKNSLLANLKSGNTFQLMTLHKPGIKGKNKELLEVRGATHYAGVFEELEPYTINAISNEVFKNHNDILFTKKYGIYFNNLINQ